MLSSGGAPQSARINRRLTSTLLHVILLLILALLSLEISRRHQFDLTLGIKGAVEEVDVIEEQS